MKQHKQNMVAQHNKQKYRATQKYANCTARKTKKNEEVAPRKTYKNKKCKSEDFGKKNERNNVQNHSKK